QEYHSHPGGKASAANLRFYSGRPRETQGGLGFGGSKAQPNVLGNPVRRSVTLGLTGESLVLREDSQFGEFGGGEADPLKAFGHDAVGSREKADEQVHG